MRKVVALILARKGSKGVPNKNTKLLNGKPLISWTIEAAIKAISGITTKTVDDTTKTVDFENFVNNVENKDDDGKSFATAYKDAGFDAGMDDANKKGIDIMEKDGMEAAVKYMFTDQDSGRQLSYGEMRMRYG